MDKDIMKCEKVKACYLKWDLTFFKKFWFNRKKKKTAKFGWPK